MKKGLILICSLLFSLVLFGQVFITQRVKIINDYGESLITKNNDKCYTEVHEFNSNRVHIVDSSKFVLIDANHIGDSLELFYQTSLNKILLKKVLCPIPINRTKDQDFSLKYLRIRDNNANGWDLSDTLILNLQPKELVRVYYINDLQITVNSAGYMRAIKNGELIWHIPHFRSSMFDVVMDYEKKDILDYQNGSILFNYVEKGGLFGKPQTYLLEIKVSNGMITFKSPFDQNVNAFYLENGDILFVSKTDGILNSVYVYDKKKKKIIPDYFGYVTNAIRL